MVETLVLNDVERGSKPRETGLVSIAKSNEERYLGERSFSTRCLNVIGEMELEVPGRKPYEGVTEIEISYARPMGVRIKGLIGEKERGLDVENSDLEVSADRVNESEVQLYRQRGLHLKDPEITLYRGARKTVLNQVQGVPVLHIKKGYVSYRQ